MNGIAKKDVEPKVVKIKDGHGYRWKDKGGNMGEVRGPFAKSRAEDAANAGVVRRTLRKLWE